MKANESLKTGRMVFVALLLILLVDQAAAQEARKPLEHPSPANGTDALTNERAPTSLLPDSILLPRERRNALGLDIMVSNSGFGLGVFYRREYSDDIYGFATFSISEAKDDREIELFNPFTGEIFAPGKVNRFLLLPLFVGVQYRLFREDIADNFRPYVSGAIGPTMVYTTPYEREFFNSIGHGQAHYTLGGYVGFGAFFGTEQSSLVGLSFRFYFAPLKNQLESLRRLYKKEFGGFFITLNIGTMY